MFIHLPGESAFNVIGVSIDSDNLSTQEHAHLSVAEHALEHIDTDPRLEAERRDIGSRRGLIFRRTPGVSGRETRNTDACLRRSR